MCIFVIMATVSSFSGPWSSLDPRAPLTWSVPAGSLGNGDGGCRDVSAFCLLVRTKVALTCLKTWQQYLGNCLYVRQSGECVCNYVCMPLWAGVCICVGSECVCLCVHTNITHAHTTHTHTLERRNGLETCMGVEPNQGEILIMSRCCWFNKNMATTDGMT